MGDTDPQCKQLVFTWGWCPKPSFLFFKLDFNIKKLISFVAVLVLTGCASVSGSKLQPLSVQTIQDGKEVAGVGCTLTNDAGKWFVTTPGSVTVQKSTGDMAVDCAKDELKGRENLVSKSNGAVWGNILLGGGIGYLIDRSSGAGFDYPNSVTVVLTKVATALGLVSSTTTSASDTPSK